MFTCDRANLVEINTKLQYEFNVYRMRENSHRDEGVLKNFYSWRRERGQIPEITIYRRNIGNMRIFFHYTFLFNNQHIIKMVAYMYMELSLEDDTVPIPLTGV